MKILITGANGQVGWELRRALAPLGEVTSVGRAQCDITDNPRVREFLCRVKADVVLNAAAYTQVDRAESEPEAAQAANAVAPALLAEAVNSYGGLLVHYSTDYVFDGSRSAPYRETDATAPVNVYGSSKLAGERAIGERGGRYLIFRTQWVYAARGKNFLRTMVRMAKEGKTLRVIHDQSGAPTWSRGIAEATAHAVRQAIDGHDISGIFHMTAAGLTTWHGFAQAIFSGLAERLPAEAVAPFASALNSLQAISTPEYPTPARRPAYSALCNDKLAATFGVRIPSWREQLNLVLDEVAEASANR